MDRLANVESASGPTESELAPIVAAIRRVRDAVATVIVGQASLIDGLLIGLISRGHVLVEGLPGVAKSTAVATLAAAVDLSFARVQFTPDLLPADIVGSEVYRPASGAFEVHRGPVFANVVLADEINRAPAKVQSALLEAMQERQVTIGGDSLPLPDPFFVLATQNPLEQEGTYELPEAQTDRFLLKLLVAYPTAEEELAILDRVGDRIRPGRDEPASEPVMTRGELVDAAAMSERVHLSEPLRRYIVDLVMATRDPDGVSRSLGEAIRIGVSPRATLGLARAARAAALLDGRGYATAADVKRVAPAVLRHRLALSYEAEAMRRTPDSVVTELLDSVPVS